MSVRETAADDHAEVIVGEIEGADGDGTFDVLVRAGVQLHIGFGERVAKRVATVAA